MITDYTSSQTAVKIKKEGKMKERKSRGKTKTDGEREKQGKRDKQKQRERGIELAKNLSNSDDCLIG